MSRHTKRLSQDPRVMVAVLVLLAIVVMARLKDLLPEPAPAAVEQTSVAELSPPADLGSVARASRKYIANAAGDGPAAAAPPPRLVEAGASPRNPFEFVSGPAPEPAAHATGAALGEAPALTCRAIMIGKASRSALVAGRIVREGETLSGLRVVRIASDGVHLADGERSLFLPLDNNESDESPAGLAVN